MQPVRHYDDYKREVEQKRKSIQAELIRIDRQKKDTHQALMKEQERASKRKTHGEKKYTDDKMALRAAQGKGQLTQNKHQKRIAHTKERLTDRLTELKLPEIILPKFSLSSADIGHKTIVDIRDGSCGYDAQPTVTGMTLVIGSTNRLAITGDNGSGKSTLIKAIMGDPHVWRKGKWFVPRPEDIGYLDQHYRTMEGETVLDCMITRVPTWAHADIRKHLNDFLFRKNEEVNAKISTSSGGEKARLSLALISAKTPQLLILDEVTNNLDIETRDHVLQILQAYPGAMILVSHDQDFLEKLVKSKVTL